MCSVLAVCDVANKLLLQADNGVGLNTGIFSCFCLFILYSLFLKDLFDEVERNATSCCLWHSSITA